MKKRCIVLQETKYSTTVLDLNPLFIYIFKDFKNIVHSKQILMIDLDGYNNDINFFYNDGSNKCIKVKSSIKNDIKNKLCFWNEFIIKNRYDDSIAIPTLINKKYINKIFPLLLDEEISEKHIKKFNKMLNSTSTKKWYNFFSA